MGGKGNGRDHAVPESFFATPKAEESAEAHATKRETHQGIAAYIRGFYNPLRLHSSLGHWSSNAYARRMQHADQPSSMRSAT